MTASLGLPGRLHLPFTLLRAATGPHAANRGQDTANAAGAIFAEANRLTPSRSGDGYIAVINLESGALRAGARAVCPP